MTTKSRKTKACCLSLPNLCLQSAKAVIFIRQILFWKTKGSTAPWRELWQSCLYHTVDPILPICVHPSQDSKAISVTHLALYSFVQHLLITYDSMVNKTNSDQLGDGPGIPAQSLSFLSPLRRCLPLRKLRLRLTGGLHHSHFSVLPSRIQYINIYYVCLGITQWECPRQMWFLSSRGT